MALQPSVEVGDVSAAEAEEGEVSPPESGEEVTPDECGVVDVEGKSSETTAKRKCRKATIIVAGRARNGKSTALNNIFGLNLTVKASSKSACHSSSLCK